MLNRREHSNKIIISLAANSDAKAITELEALLTKASNHYYNTNKFLKINILKSFPAAFHLLNNDFEMPAKTVTIDDETYDVLIDELKRMKPSSKVLKRVGAKVTATKGKPPKVKLKYYMGSLDKIKPEDADPWLVKHKGPYVVGNKEDGVSIQLNFNPGFDPKAYTRGDGSVGQDISHLITHMDIPQSLKIPMDIRGEIIMPEAVFKKKWSVEALGKKEGFENARNMVSGLVNRKDVHPAIKDVHVVVYSVLNPRGVPSQQLKKLAKLGFNVVPHKVYNKLTAKKLAEILTLRKKKTKRAIDGLVVEQDKAVSVRDGVNPDHAVAFKMSSAEDIVIVTVKAVVWEESRHGTLVPRVEIDPIRLAGVTVTFATGHNAWFIEHGYRYKDRKKNMPIRFIGPGAKIKITRSGDVIPHIISVEKGVKKPSMPEDVEYKYGKNRVQIQINTKSELSKVKRITHFFSKLKVDGVKQGIIQKLYDDGLTSILKIVRADKERFLEVEGIQEKTAKKLRDNIAKMLKTATLPALMEASGQFGSGMGERRLKPLIKANPKIMSKKLSKAQLRAIAMDTEGFSDILSDQFADRFDKFAAFYKKLGVKAAAPAVTKVVGSKFKDQVVAFTGVRDAEANKAIEAQGGTVGSGVSSKTTILVTKEKNSTSAKAMKAREMKIDVISIEQLRKRLKL